LNDGVGWKFGVYTIRHQSFRIHKYRFPSFSNPLLVVAGQAGDSLHKQPDALDVETSYVAHIIIHKISLENSYLIKICRE